MADKGTQLGVAQVPIRGDLEPLDKDLDKARSKITKTLDKLAGEMKAKLAGLGKAAVLGGLGALTAAVGGLTVALVNSVGAAAEEQEGIAQLSAAVRASGADWDTASEAIERYLALELQRTALDDGEGREAIARLTQATGDYRTALALMGLTQDLARAKGLALANTAEIVGKVAAGNTSILTRYGIVLEKGATATEALTEMQRRFAGQAEAYANTLRGQTAIINTQLGNISEIVGGALEPALTRLAQGASNMLSIIQTALDMTAPLFEAEFTAIAEAALGHGEGTGASFAQGIANSLPYLLTALMIIRGLVDYWLKPGSPPRLLPDLEKWGTAAMEAYFEGWTQADFGILSSMTGTLRGVLSALVGQGLIEQGEDNPILRALRGQLAAALDELRRTGIVSEETYAGIRAAGGAAGPAAEQYARRMLGVEEARLKVKRLEEELAAATTAEQVLALAQQLDAAREEQKAAEEALSLEEERLNALTEESNLMARQLELMEQQVSAITGVAKATEESAKAAADLASTLGSLALPESLTKTTGESPFASMFDAQRVKDEAERMFNELWPEIQKWLDIIAGRTDEESREDMNAFERTLTVWWQWCLDQLGLLGRIAQALMRGDWGTFVGGIVELFFSIPRFFLDMLKEFTGIDVEKELAEVRKGFKRWVDGVVKDLQRAIDKLKELLGMQEKADSWSYSGGGGGGGSAGAGSVPSIGGQASGLAPTWFRRPTHMLVGEAGPELVSVIPRSKLRSAAGGVVYYSQTINVQDRAYAALLALERDRYLRSVERGW